MARTVMVEDRNLGGVELKKGDNISQMDKITRNMLIGRGSAVEETSKAKEKQNEQGEA